MIAVLFFLILQAPPALPDFSLNHFSNPTVDLPLERNGIDPGEKRKLRITGIMTSRSWLAVDVDLQFRLNGQVIYRIEKVMSGGQRLNVLTEPFPVPDGKIQLTAELLRADGMLFGYPLYPASIQFRNLALSLE